MTLSHSLLPQRPHTSHLLISHPCTCRAAIPCSAVYNARSPSTHVFDTGTSHVGAFVLGFRGAVNDACPDLHSTPCDVPSDLSHPLIPRRLSGPCAISFGRRGAHRCLTGRCFVVKEVGAGLIGLTGLYQHDSPCVYAAGLSFPLCMWQRAAAVDAEHRHFSGGGCVLRHPNAGPSPSTQVPSAGNFISQPPCFQCLMDWVCHG